MGLTANNKEMLEDIATYFFVKINEASFENDPLPLLPVRCINEPGEYYAGLTRAAGGKPQDIVLNFAHLKEWDDCIAILAHEMIHVSCFLKGIPQYENGHHLQGFIDEAERHGLIFDEEPYLNLFDLGLCDLLPEVGAEP